jgi:hypothetical protein
MNEEPSVLEPLIPRHHPRGAELTALRTESQRQWCAKISFWPGRMDAIIWGVGYTPLHFQALLVIVFFMIAIYQAWHMIGARNTRVLAMVGDLLPDRTTTTIVLDGIEEGDDDGAAMILVAAS